jgi:hypothetical protein
MQAPTAFLRFIDQPLVAPLIALAGTCAAKAGYGAWAGSVSLSLVSLYFAAVATAAATATSRPPAALGKRSRLAPLRFRSMPELRT